MKKARESADNHSIYEAGVADRFVDAMLSRGQIAFTLSEVTAKTRLSVVAARNQLLRLGPKVTRVSPRQDFFLAVSPEHQVMGAPPVAWWLDAYFRWLGRPYYLALQSAAAEYGSTAQAIQVVQVMTDRSRRPLHLGRIRVEFFTKNNAASIPTQAPSHAYAPLHVSTPAATIIDLVRYAPRIGGIARATETLLPLLPKLRGTELTLALKADKEVANIQRLGYILDTLNYPALADLTHAQLSRRLNRVPLAVGQGKDAACNAYLSTRWSILINTQILETAWRP